MRKVCSVCRGTGIVKKFIEVREYLGGMPSEELIKDFEDCSNCNGYGVVEIPIEQALVVLNDLVNEFVNTCPHEGCRVVLIAYRKEIQDWIAKVDAMLRM